MTTESMPEESAVMFRIPGATEHSRIDCFAVDLNELSGAFFDREIDRDYGGVPAYYEIGFIGQSDLVSTWRAEDGGDDFTRKTLVLGTHAHYSNQTHLKDILLLDVGPAANRSKAKSITVCHFVSAFEQSYGMADQAWTRCRPVADGDASSFMNIGRLAGGLQRRPPRAGK
jgi:hypothetical protein